MIDRREFILALGATGLLTACQSGPPKPSVITVNLAGGAGMNPGPGGGDRPVTVMILRLKSTGAFNSADYFALQGGAGSALGGYVGRAIGGTASHIYPVTQFRQKRFPARMNNHSCDAFSIALGYMRPAAR